MVAFPKSLCLFLALFMVTTVTTHAYFDINVGGTKGWTVNPTEDYDIWAARMRFSINDTIHFSYNKAIDSVLVVSRDDYDKCNTQKPITILGGGDSSFTLNRSGPFYFITGNKTNCDEGLKMHLIVMAIRNTNTKPQPPSPSPTISSPATGVAAPNNDNVSTALPPLAQASAAAAASTISFLMITLALFSSTQLF